MLKVTIEAASLNKPSVCSVPVIRFGIPAGPATASTATGSGGAIAAAITIAAARLSPGRIHIAVAVSAAMVRNTKITLMVSTTFSCDAICPQLVRLASDHNKGGRKIGKIRCGGIDTVSMPGMKINGTTTMVRSAGQGMPVRSPIAATKTVASSSPISAINVPTPAYFRTRVDTISYSLCSASNTRHVVRPRFGGKSCT